MRAEDNREVFFSLVLCVSRSNRFSFRTGSLVVFFSLVRTVHPPAVYRQPGCCSSVHCLRERRLDGFHAAYCFFAGGVVWAGYFSPACLVCVPLHFGRLDQQRRLFFVLTGLRRFWFAHFFVGAGGFQLARCGAPYFPIG